MPDHVMLSYQWDLQDLVKIIYAGLKKRGMNVWMDIEGGMSGNINDSMAFGVDNSAAVCCFMTSKYQESKNCKKELNYADSCDKLIVPCMSEQKFKASGWLGIITAGMLWIDLRERNNIDVRIDSLAKELVHQAGNAIVQLVADRSAPIVKQNPGRAFRHKITGKYLAETGQQKFHPASGTRSNLVTRDKAEETSYWVEEKGAKGSGIFYFKNYSTNGYLGYDPNGDYTYTKGQHYGAEEWLYEMNDTTSSGHREVVIFANFGKKYLAIRNGKFTGVSTKDKDCIWIVE